MEIIAAGCLYILKKIVLRTFSGFWLKLSQRRRAKKLWQSKRVEEVLFTMTGIVKGVLKIRALHEATMQDLFGNPEAVRIVVNASRRTSQHKPLLQLPDDIHTETILTSLLVEVSSLYPEGNARYIAGLPTHDIPCWICLSRELEAPEHTDRVRVEVVPRSLLESLPGEEPRYDYPSHAVRWVTLQAMQQALRDTPHLLMEVVIHLPERSSHEA